LGVVPPHPLPDVRIEAVAALDKLEPAARTPYAGAIAGLLEDSIEWVRVAAVESLGKFEPAALTPHADAIVGLFTDPMLRYDAVELLGKLEPAARTPYAGAIVGMLADSNPSVRNAAIRLFAAAEMGMLAPDVLEPAISAVTNMLTDTDYYVLVTATVTLINLKHRRARLHWAKARAFVHLVRPYALVWHEYVGERLCAPGGVWAERDCSAFEEEFIYFHRRSHCN